mgnify:FL=1
MFAVKSDLEGSTGLKAIHKKHPEVFISSGIMERFVLMCRLILSVVTEL